MLAAGADPNAPGQPGVPPLNLAVEYLLERWDASRTLKAIRKDLKVCLCVCLLLPHLDVAGWVSNGVGAGVGGLGALCRHILS